VKARWIGTVILVSAVALSFSAGAMQKLQAKDAVKNAGFERIKALSGEWEATPSQGQHEGHGGTVAYKVTAGGSAVVETLFGGSEHEMVTLYYVEGEDLALTHFCMLQNRPRMRAERGSSPDKIVFKCQDGENAKIEGENHMHQATFTFVDSDHFKTEWVLYKGGKPDSAHSFDLVRKRK
jgi:hypothetical protein